MTQPPKYTPAKKEYWDDFYLEGEGASDIYEWYTDFSKVKHLLVPLISAGDKILHIGAGNSLLAERILADPDFPPNLIIVNVDICEPIIERMQQRLSAMFEWMESQRNQQRKPTKKTQSEFKEAIEAVFSANPSRYFKPEQISYKIGDVTNLPEYSDGSFDLVLDKGMLDAVLSHGEEDFGIDETVRKVNREMYRLLKHGGHYIIISGNGSCTTLPYFVGDPDVLWDVQEHSFQVHRRDGGKQMRTLYFYDLVADKSEA